MKFCLGVYLSIYSWIPKTRPSEMEIEQQEASNTIFLENGF